MSRIIIFLINFYKKLISPMIGYNKCRFYPTCSNYMIEAIEKKGLLKGLFLGTLRILKCQPFSKKSGYDPVENEDKIK